MVEKSIYNSREADAWEHITSIHAKRISPITDVSELLSILSLPNFELAVNMGLLPGFSVIDKFGENPDIDTATTPEDLWEFGGPYPYDADGTAPIQYVSSSSAADTGQLISVRGLDIDGYEVTQTITTNGQNNVTLTTPLWRVYRMQNISDYGNDLAGTLYCHTDPTPTAGVPLNANVRAIIDNGNNQTLMCMITIPRGYVGYLFRGEVGASRIKVTSGALQASYYSKRVGKVFAIKKRFSTITTGSSIYQDKRSFPDIIPALTDVKITIEAVSANDTGVFGTFDILLIEENILSDAFLTAIGQPTSGPGA